MAGLFNYFNNFDKDKLTDEITWSNLDPFTKLFKLFIEEGRFTTGYLILFIVLSFIVPITPIMFLIIRIYWLNGSLDGRLSLLCPISYIPPFSTFQVLLMHMGYYNNGGGINPIDNNIYYVIALKFVFFLLKISNLFQDYKILESIIEQILVLSALILINCIRRRDVCKPNDNDKNTSYIDYIWKASIDSISLVLFSEILIKILMFIIEFLIPLDIFGNDIERFIKILIWVFCLFFSYILNNMLNQHNTGIFCSTKIFGNIYDNTVFGIVLILFIIVIYYKEKNLQYFINNLRNLRNGPHNGPRNRPRNSHNDSRDNSPDSRDNSPDSRDNSPDSRDNSPDSRDDSSDSRNSLPDSRNDKGGSFNNNNKIQRYINNDNKKKIPTISHNINIYPPNNFTNNLIATDEKIIKKSPIVINEKIIKKSPIVTNKKVIKKSPIVTNEKVIKTNQLVTNKKVIKINQLGGFDNLSLI
jgi:hypothetical protein